MLLFLFDMLFETHQKVVILNVMGMARNASESALCVCGDDKLTDDVSISQCAIGNRKMITRYRCTNTETHVELQASVEQEQQNYDTSAFLDFDLIKFKIVWLF